MNDREDDLASARQRLMYKQRGTFLLRPTISQDVLGTKAIGSLP